MIFKKKTFIREQVVLEGNAFYNCNFLECEVVFTGSDNFILKDSTFDNVRWSFVGAAGNTLEFLNIIYNKFPPDGRTAVENIYQFIRGDPIPGADQVS